MRQDWNEEKIIGWFSYLDLDFFLLFRSCDGTKWVRVICLVGVSVLLLVWMPVDVSQLKQRIGEVLEAKAELKRLTAKPYEKLSTDAKSAIRYQVIVLAEGLGNVCLHIAKKDLGQEPISYSDCFKLLDEKGISDKCAGYLTGLIGLRNLLVHRYWTIDDRRVYNSARDGFYGVDKFLEMVKEKYAVDL